jgi:fucose permease
MLVLGAIMQILGSAFRTWMSPFPFWAFTFSLVSLGQAYQDTHCNTFVATAKSPHRWLGFIHAMYMLGCLVSPFASNAVASANTPSRWNLFYTVPLGIGVANLGLALYAFWDTVGLKKKKSEESRQTGEENKGDVGATKMVQKALSIPGVWILSLFYFFYIGAVLTAGGWVGPLRCVAPKNFFSFSFSSFLATCSC